MDSFGTFEQLILFCVLRLGDDAYGVAIRDTLEIVGVVGSLGMMDVEDAPDDAGSWSPTRSG